MLPQGFRLHTAATSEIAPADLHSIRVFLDAAFEGDFSEEDWGHCLGGTHVWITGGSGDAGDAILAHGSVVPRQIVYGDHRLRTGYVEAVATAETHRRQGLGSTVMRKLAEIIRDQYEIGGLSSGERAFYQSLGWTLWRGPSYVRHPEFGVQPTPDDDDGLFVLAPDARTSLVDLDSRIIADWRTGAVW